jgi:hypothetical protein
MVQFFVNAHSKGSCGKNAHTNKKTPIWRFIPLNPRDGAEVAFPGRNRTFTYPVLYAAGTLLSRGKSGKNEMF